MTDTNRPSPDSPELEPQLESAVWSVLSEPIDMAAVERVKSRAANLTATPPRPSYRGPIFTLTSLAAGILLAVGAVTMFSSTPPAFASVIEQLKTAGTLRYTQLVYTDQQDQPIEVQVLVAGDGRQRSEMAGTISIMDSSGHSRLTLIEATKTAIVPEQKNASQDMGQRQLQWLEQLKSHGGKPDRRLGAKTLDGRRVEGFVAKQGLHEFTIWVDATSNELVQIEHDGMVKGSPVKKVVMKGFRFNETLDESLFSFEVPRRIQSAEAASGRGSAVWRREYCGGAVRLHEGLGREIPQEHRRLGRVGRVPRQQRRVAGRNDRHLRETRSHPALPDRDAEGRLSVPRRRQDYPR